MPRVFIFFVLIFSLVYGHPIWYESKNGENLVQISQKLKVNYKDLQFYNPKVKRLNVGTKLKIPPFEYHKVSSKETYRKIAEKYGVNYKELMQLNRSKKITKGDVIRLKKLVFNEEKKVKNKTNQEAKKELSSSKTSKENNEVKEEKEKTSLKNPLKEASEEDSLDGMMEEQKKVQLYELIRNKSFVFPVKGNLEEFYGLGDSIMNYGINLKLDDDKIYASEAGVVNYVGNMRGVGKVILVSHGGGIFSLYSGDLKSKVKKGQRVDRKEIIGTSKSDVFFGVYKEGDPLNPFALLLK